MSEAGERFELRAALWIWKSAEAPASWHFVTIDGEVGDAIRATMLMRRLEGGGQRRGWGSVKVSAQIGDSRWQTSLFPHKESGGWLLPVKGAIRKAEGIVDGDEVAISLIV